MTDPHRPLLAVWMYWISSPLPAKAVPGHAEGGVSTCLAGVVRSAPLPLSKPSPARVQDQGPLAVSDV